MKFHVGTLVAECGLVLKPSSVKLARTENVKPPKKRVMFMATPVKTVVFVVVVVWSHGPHSSGSGPDHVILGATLPR